VLATRFVEPGLELGGEVARRRLDLEGRGELAFELGVGVPEFVELAPELIHLVNRSWLIQPRRGGRSGEGLDRLLPQ
jgi:hypothetical protein